MISPGGLPGAFAVASLIFLGACSGDNHDGERLGRAVGAAAGAATAADAAKDSPPAVRAAAVVLGAFIGSWLGGEVGRGLDELDRIYVERAMKDGLENNSDGEPTIWSNPDSGNSGSVTPTNTVQTEENVDCRDFETTVVIDDKEEQTTGRACKQADGTWKVVSGETAS